MEADASASSSDARIQDREQLLAEARRFLSQQLAHHSKSVRWLERCLTARTSGHLALLLTAFTLSYW